MIIKRPPPFTRALRNSILISFALGFYLQYQQVALIEILTILLLSLTALLPVLWLAYSYTAKLLDDIDKRTHQEETRMNLINIGDPAPDFNLLNENNTMRSLQSFYGKNIILYFYPKDDTPGCTLEAKDFTALAKEFEANNTVILGISQDDIPSHQAFKEKFKLQIELLADTHGQVCKAYKVWQEKEKNGQKKMGIVRSTFIINPHRTIVYAEYGVNPENHAQAILAQIKALNTA